MANAARNATRRLLREFETWQADQAEYVEASKADAGAEENNPNQGIERLGPSADGDDLFRWQAVLNGKGLGGGYDDGRWLLQIEVPQTYPLQPPTIRFVTHILHANVHPTTGAVCLDLLQETGSSGGAWTPALSIAACMRAIRLLLTTPGTDSPLNVDLAALLRSGDNLAASYLVRLWCQEERYNGA